MSCFCTPSVFEIMGDLRFISGKKNLLKNILPNVNYHWDSKQTVLDSVSPFDILKR